MIKEDEDRDRKKILQSFKGKPKAFTDICGSSRQ